MELTNFVAYLDYGVLGLSAIILILSFVLLSREQKREVFRPEVGKAIRKYMMLALAFAAVGLVSTIVEGMLVRPGKVEKKKQEQRMDLLSSMISKEMEKRIDITKSGIKSVNPLIDAIIPSNNEGETDNSNTVVPAPSAILPVEADSVSSDKKLTNEERYDRMRESVFMSFYDFRADKDLFKESLNKLGKEHKVVEKNKEKILGDYDELATLKEKWLEEKAIPTVQQNIASDTGNAFVVIKLPNELVPNKNVETGINVTDLGKLKSELEMLRLSKKK